MFDGSEQSRLQVARTAGTLVRAVHLVPPGVHRNGVFEHRARLSTNEKEGSLNIGLMQVYAGGTMEPR